MPSVPAHRIDYPCARTGSPRDGLNPMQLWVLALVVALLHGLAIWCLLQIPAVHQVVSERLPVWVSWVDQPAPSVSKPSAPATPTPKRTAPHVASPAAPKVARPPAAVPTAAAPAAQAVPAASPPTPLAPAPPAALVLEAPSSPSAAIAPPAAPRRLPSTAITYLVPPSPHYPDSARDDQESGTVTVEVLIGDDGKQRSVKISRSSGYARLDRAALSAVSKARFNPPMVEGQAVSGYATIPITFEPEK
jgi:periplasmic protein TonB